MACHHVAVKKAGLLLAVLVLVAVAVTLYSAAGWRKMESACSLDGPKGQVHAGVSYSWSWQPLGFECTYDDGTSETSLWPS